MHQVFEVEWYMDSVVLSYEGDTEDETARAHGSEPPVPHSTMNVHSNDRHRWNRRLIPVPLVRIRLAVDVPVGNTYGLTAGRVMSAYVTRDGRAFVEGDNGATVKLRAEEFRPDSVAMDVEQGAPRARNRYRCGAG